MDGYRDIGWADLPCNYVQIMENAVDPHHVEWLHGRYFEFMGRHEGFTAPASFGKEHIKIGFTPFEWGIIKRRVLRGATEENDDWKVGHPLVFPYNMRVGGGGVHQMQIRVPINRTTTRFMLYTVHSPDGYEHVDQPQIPDYRIPVIDQNGRHVTNYVEGQDIMAWVTQGAITDRTTEHLGRSDIGVAMLRKMFRDQMDAVAAGRGPARHDPRAPRAHRPAVREGQVQRGRCPVRARLLRHGLHAVLPGARHHQEDPHLGGREDRVREMTTPVDRRFAADAEAHRRDAPRFCPSCGGGLAIATEFWEADDRRFYCSCTGCGWTGEITPTGAVAVGHEPDH